MENSEILSLFGTLPDVPLSRVFDYLNVPKLLMISLQCPEWKEFCYHRIQKMNQENENDSYYSLTIHNDVLTISNQKHLRSNMFSVSLKVNTMEDDFCCYRKEVQKLNRELNENWEEIEERQKHALLIDCANDDIMEEIYINIFNMINPPSLDNVDINVNRNGKIEKMKLSEQILTGKTVTMMFLKGREAKIVDENEVNSVVNAAEKVNCLVMDVFPSAEFNYDNLDSFHVSLSVSRNDAAERLTIDHLKKVNCRSYRIWQPIYGPEHVNVFLRSWMSGGNQNVREIDLKLYRTANEEDMQKMFEGLDPKEWDPERREPRFLIDDPTMMSLLRFENLSGAKDFVRSDGTVGTLSIQSGKHLKFFVWTDRFPWRNKRESIKQRLVECEEFLAQNDKNLVAEIDKEISEYEQEWFFADSQFYKKSRGLKRKIIDKMMMKKAMEKFFNKYEPYLTEFDD